MNFTLEFLPDSFAICRLDPDAPVPDWAKGDSVSITRTRDELTVVCRQNHVSDEVEAERGWRCLRIVGKLDFSLLGVIATLSTVLADAGISVFVMSTFDTDYRLVKEADVDRAVEALEKAGFSHETGTF